MYYGATAFNADLSNWDLFKGHVHELNASAFNASLSKWDAPRATYIKYMLFGACAFNVDLSK